MTRIGKVSALMILAAVGTGCGQLAPSTSTPTSAPASDPTTFPSPAFSSSVPSAPTPRTTIYQVPSAACPNNYPTGLAIETSNPDEVDYLSKVVACRTADGANTYLKNDSTAVFVVKSLNGSPWEIRHEDDDPAKSSFRAAFSNGLQVLTPDDAMTVSLPPADLEWDISLQTSVAWQGDELVVEKLQSLGEKALVDELADRTSKPFAAVTQCALGVHSSAEDAEHADPDELTSMVTTGLGVGVTGAQCTIATKQVLVTDPRTGKLESLADELDQLKEGGEALERTKQNLETAQRFAIASEDVLRLISHH